MRNVHPSHDHPIVCIDLGHRGPDYNKGAAPGYYESARMWELGQIQAEMMRRIGIEVVMTRSNRDKDLELTQRGRMAKGADIMESLHSNACNDPTVDRPVGIYLVDDDCGPIDELSKAFADLMATAVRDCMDTNGSAQIYSRKSDKDRDHDGLKNDDYYGVLYGAHQVGVPAIIMEHSFHTNPRMAEWLMSDANLQKLALAKTAAYARWFEIPMEVIATKPAAERDDDLAGAYRVTAEMLNVRHGAGTKHDIMTTIPEGTEVRNYGYYTTADNGTRWLYVRFKVDGIVYVGFCSEKHLKRV